MKSIATIAAEFDAIAIAAEANPRRDVLTPAERSILSHVPANATRGLDVGCGDGILTRAAARREIAMLGVDVSPQMIDLARARTGADARIEYCVADIMTDTFAERSFDFVMTINMVHHVVLADVVPRLARLVAPGGVLLIQDVVTRSGARYLPLNAVAAVRSRFRRLVMRSRIAPPVAALYDAHGEGEVYLEPAQVAPAYSMLLPGARVFQHLEWRYSVVWRRGRPAEVAGRDPEA